MLGLASETAQLRQELAKARMEAQGQNAKMAMLGQIVGNFQQSNRTCGIYCYLLRRGASNVLIRSF